MSQFDLKFDLKTKVDNSNCISQSIDFALYLEKYFMYKQHTISIAKNYDLK